MLALPTIVFHWLCLFLITCSWLRFRGLICTFLYDDKLFIFFLHWESYNGMASYITQLLLWLEVFPSSKMCYLGWKRFRFALEVSEKLAINLSKLSIRTYTDKIWVYGHFSQLVCPVMDDDQICLASFKYFLSSNNDDKLYEKAAPAFCCHTAFCMKCTCYSEELQ